MVGAKESREPPPEKGMDTMRRIVALLALLGVIQFSIGCRHVAGGCDCEHAGKNAPAGVATPVASAPAQGVVVKPTTGLKMPVNSFNPNSR
jgi:hypothetical protein